MNKFASELILKPVLVRDAIANGEGAMVGVVESLVINPDDGKLAGVTVREGFGKKNLKTLSTKDILGISSEFYLVPSYDSLGDLDEIVRLKEIMDLRIPIIGNKVYTESGVLLGRVFDYTLDLITFTIARIYVKPGLLGGLARQYIIYYNNIVSIEKDRITVADLSVKSKKSVLLKSPAIPKTADCSDC